jgi:O-antigen ligase
MSKVNLNSLRENVFFIVLLIYVAFLPFSEALVSISAGLLLFQSLVLTSWKHPSVKSENSISLFMILSIFLIYVVGMINTEDFSFALYELRKVSFWIVLPLAFFLSPRLPAKKIQQVLLLFCLAVFAASVVAIVRLIFSDNFQIDDFREITMISHIRYSFQVVLSIILTGYFVFQNDKQLQVKISRGVLVTSFGWLIGFLFILKSITGIVAFLGTLGVLLLLVIFRIKKPLLKVSLLFLLVLLIVVPVFYVVRVWNQFYDIEKLNPHNVQKYTASGNPYYFDFSATEKENGNWVNAYINREELRKEWNKRSEAKFDSLDENGYSYRSTLIRYLTSKGLRKDSAGVSQLTESDISAIENGIANHIYVDRGFSVYPRVYETIWELDRYLNSGNPNDQSFSQRIEFIKASLLLIKKNFWLGIGTGNWKIDYANAYDEMNSKLKPENQWASHNQYLNYMVKFGIIGFIYIFSMLLVPIFREGHQKNLIFWLFLISISIANLGDANFETHMGLSFFCFFYCLFLWHSPKRFNTFHS